MKRSFTDIVDFDEGSLIDSSENEYSHKFEKQKDAVIYLIDARKNMFLPFFEEDKLPIIRCLESVRTALRKKIFRVEKCYCCIVLLGTKKAENEIKLNNMTVVQELELLGASHILKIDDLIKAVDDLKYESCYGCEKFSLGDALWLSSYLYNQKSIDLNKSVIYFTNDEGPTTDDPNEQRRAVAKAQDLNKSFVTFDIISLGKQFDYDKFYKKIIQASKNDANCVIPDPVTSVSEIVEKINKTDFQHVNLVKLPFFVSDDFQIGVSVHFLVRKAKIPFKVKLSKATNELVTTKTEYFEAETGSVVKKEDLIRSQVIAQMDISFTPSELKTIQEIGKMGLRLLGFKPISVLRLENYVKPCAFIYPDETECKGSSVFFTALLKRCLAKQVVPICTFCPRTSSSYRFVALIPQDKCSEDDKDQLPPGFIVFFLPFAEEVRKFEEKRTKRATPEQVDIAVNLIKKLRFPYRVSNFQNPKIKHHWAAIEALALDLKEPEEVNDSTIPNYNLMSQRCGEIALEFMDSVYEDDYQPEDFTPARKPKPNLQEPKTEIHEEDVENLMRQGQGERLSNDVLKKYLKSIGVTKGLSKMRKADLLEKVRDQLNMY